MLRRPIACTLLLWYLAACTTWHVEKGVSPSQLISAKHPTAVRLTRTNGSYLFLQDPRVAAGDSLVTFQNGVFSNVAVSDFTQVATRKVSASKTIGLGLGVAVGSALLAAIVVAVQCNSSSAPDYCDWE